MIIHWARDIKIGKYESLSHDLARIFLILQVVIGHVVALTLPPLPVLFMEPFHNSFALSIRLLIRYGSQAAYLFVFLSGYMVAGPLIFDLAQRRALIFGAFVQGRLRKLVPGMFIGLAVTLLFDGLGMFLFEKSSYYKNIFGVDVINNFNFYTFIGNVVFLEPTFVPTFGSNGPLWTLGYILQFYLVGFAAFRIISRSSMLGIAFLTAMLGAVASFRLEWSILFIVWLIGGWVRNIVLSVNPSPGLSLSAASLILVSSNVIPPLYSAAASALVGTALVLCFREIKCLVIEAYEPAIKLVAAQTYLAYAVHFPILVFVISIVDVNLNIYAKFSLATALVALGIGVVSMLEKVVELLIIYRRQRV